jgi:hypothetical protein
LVDLLAPEFHPVLNEETQGSVVPNLCYGIIR